MEKNIMLQRISYSVLDNARGLLDLQRPFC